MGVNLASAHIAWLQSLTEEERLAHYRGERPFSDAEWRLLVEKMVQNMPIPSADVDTPADAGNMTTQAGSRSEPAVPSSSDLGKAG